MNFKKVAIVGAGYTGIELAAAVAEKWQVSVLIIDPNENILSTAKRVRNSLYGKGEER